MAIAISQLEDMTDQQLHELIAAAGGLLEKRRHEEREKAIAEARARLAAVGLTFRDVSRSANGGAKKRPSSLRNGDRYVNPADSGEAYVVGRGRRPKWFIDLEKSGGLPAPQRGDAARK